MFKKIFANLFILILIILSVPFANAQNEIQQSLPSDLKAAIQADTSLEANKNIIFDASTSFIPDPEREITYEWDFGDGNSDQGVEVVHTYKRPSLYKVKLKISDGENESEAMHNLHVYRKLSILITDNTDAAKRIYGIKNYAFDQQVFIQEIQSFGSASEFISEELLVKRLSENVKIVEKTKQIMVWTKGNAGLNALSRFLKDSGQTLSGKTVVFISDDIESSARRIQKQFPLLKPEKIIVTLEGTVFTFIDSTSDEEFLGKLEEGGYKYKVIDQRTGKLRIWNFMSYFLNSLIESGVPDNTVLLILLLPIIATVVAFMRQVVGVTTFGVYSPSIITLAFLILGLKFGLMTFIMILAMGALVRHGMRRLRLLFIPKMAIVLTVVALTIFAILIASTYFNWFDAEFITLAIFPILVMSTLTEKFINTQTERGFMSAMVLMGETIIVSIVAYFVAGGIIDFGFFSIQTGFIKNLMLTYPELIFFIFIINILLGKWTGLRILEYVRFREILRHIEE
jgi:hypothetical protein